MNHTDQSWPLTQCCCAVRQQKPIQLGNVPMRCLDCGTLLLLLAMQMTLMPQINNDHYWRQSQFTHNQSHGKTCKIYLYYSKCFFVPAAVLQSRLKYAFQTYNFIWITLINIPHVWPNSELFWKHFNIKVYNNTHICKKYTSSLIKLIHFSFKNIKRELYFMHTES